MMLTQRLIIVLGDYSLISNDNIIKTIAGFHACTVIRTLNEEMLKNIFYYNKNAVYFATTYSMQWSQYNPIIIRLAAATDVTQNLLGTDDIINDFPKILNSENVDVGDHSSQDSTGMVSQSTSECLLCRIYERTTEHKEFPVYETENFYVLPGLGAFFDGYLMIVPKAHVMSFALLGDKILSEFYQVLSDISSILEAIYGKKVFAFECSSGKTGAGKHKTSIVHAHFHLAPTDMPVLREVQKSGLHPCLIQKEDLSQYGEYPYMLYVDQEDNWFMACDPKCYYPRQQPRQVLANWMDCYEVYNWRYHPMREKLQVIAEEFRNYCRMHLDELPTWVQNSIIFE